MEDVDGDDGRESGEGDGTSFDIDIEFGRHATKAF